MAAVHVLYVSVDARKQERKKEKEKKKRKKRKKKDAIAQLVEVGPKTQACWRAFTSRCKKERKKETKKERRKERRNERRKERKKSGIAQLVEIGPKSQAYWREFNSLWNKQENKTKNSCQLSVNTSSIAFRHLPPNSARTEMALSADIGAAVHRRCQRPPKGLGTNQTPSTGLRHPSFKEGAGKRCSECGY